MAEQETRERGDAGATDATSETGTSTEGAEPEAGGADSSTSTESSESSESTEKSGDSEKSGSSERSGSSGKTESSEKEGSSEETSEESSGEGGQTPARRSENHAKPQAPSDSDREAQEANRRSLVGGRSEEDAPPSGEQRRASVDVGELVWKVANILATVIRVVTLVFAVVLVAHIALVVVGVNPENGVAAFLRGFADTVVLGFRDLFLPADPTIALVVNYGVAAVFWVVVGGFLSAGVRFLAARIN